MLYGLSFELMSLDPIKIVDNSESFELRRAFTGSIAFIKLFIESRVNKKPELPTLEFMCLIIINLFYKEESVCVHIASLLIA